MATSPIRERLKILRAILKSQPAIEASWGAECITNFLDGKARSLDHAFGLKGGKGRPPSPKIQELHLKIAQQVLKMELQGTTLTGNRDDEGAFVIVGRKYNKSASQVREIYYENLVAATLLERLREADKSRNTKKASGG